MVTFHIANVAHPESNYKSNCGTTSNCSYYVYIWSPHESPNSPAYTYYCVAFDRPNASIGLLVTFGITN